MSNKFVLKNNSLVLHKTNNEYFHLMKIFLPLHSLTFIICILTFKRGIVTIDYFRYRDDLFGIQSLELREQEYEKTRKQHFPKL